MARIHKSVVKLESGLWIPAGAAAGKVLTSDASGNAAWAGPAIPSIASAAALATAEAGGTGTVVAYQDSVMTTAGVVWMLRFNGTDWDFLGGAPLINEQASVGTSSVTHSNWQDLSVTGPTVTVSLVGTYQITYGGLLSTAAISGNAVSMSIDALAAGGAGAGDNDAALIGTTAAVVESATPSRITQRTITTTGGTFYARYRSSSGSIGQISAQRRWMSVLPVKVG